MNAVFERLQELIPTHKTEVITKNQIKMASETIEIKGVEFEVTYSYQPEEPEVRYYPDGSGNPGCPAKFEIEKITHNGTDFTEFFDGDYGLIEERLIEKLQNYIEY